MSRSFRVFAAAVFLFLTQVVSTVVLASPPEIVKASRQISTVGQAREAMQDFSAAMDSAAKQCMEQQHIPGLAIVVVVNGKTVLRRGYGVANVESETAVDPDETLFRIGSISKALTFLTLSRLIDDGRINRNDPVTKYFGPIENPHGFENEITIDHLLTHTAGFDHVGLERHACETLRPGLSEYLNDNNLRRVTEAGEMFRYDTCGTLLAGAIIEKVTGKRFAVAMKQEMFDTLGMDSTFVEADKEAKDRLALGYAWSDGKFEPQDYEVYATTPSSSIDASISDMGLLLEALTAKGANRHGRLFSQTMNDAVMAPQFRAHPEFPGVTHGLFESYTSNMAETETHLRTIGHGGSMDGFRSAMTLIPNQRIGVFITANRSSEAGGGEVDFNQLLNMVVNRISDAPQRSDLPVPTDVVVSLDEYEGDYCCGTFCDEPTRPAVEDGDWPQSRIVEKTESGLAIGGQEFLPFEKDVFVQKDGKRMVVFNRDARGKVSHFVYSSSPDTFERDSPMYPYPRIQTVAKSTSVGKLILQQP